MPETARWPGQFSEDTFLPRRLAGHECKERVRPENITNAEAEPAAAVTNSYRRIARYYDRLIKPMNAGVRRVADQVLPPEPGWSVLGVGCGTGIGLERHLDVGCHGFGVDVSPAMLERARARLGDRQIVDTFDGAGFPFENHRFDLVTTSLVLHEVEADQRTDLLAEMVRLLNRDGRLLIIDFRFGSLRGLKWRVTKAAIYVIERFGGRYRGYCSLRTQGWIPRPRSPIRYQHRTREGRGRWKHGDPSARGFRSRSGPRLRGRADRCGLGGLGEGLGPHRDEP